MPHSNLPNQIEWTVKRAVLNVQYSNSSIFVLNCEIKWQQILIKKPHNVCVRKVSDGRGNAPRKRFCANVTQREAKNWNIRTTPTKQMHRQRQHKRWQASTSATRSHSVLIIRVIAVVIVIITAAVYVFLSLSQFLLARICGFFFLHSYAFCNWKDWLIFVPFVLTSQTNEKVEKNKTNRKQRKIFESFSL